MLRPDSIRSVLRQLEEHVDGSACRQCWSLEHVASAGADAAAIARCLRSGVGGAPPLDVLHRRETRVRVLEATVSETAPVVFNQLHRPTKPERSAFRFSCGRAVRDDEGRPVGERGGRCPRTERDEGYYNRRAKPPQRFHTGDRYSMTTGIYPSSTAGRTLILRGGSTSIRGSSRKCCHPLIAGRGHRRSDPRGRGDHSSSNPAQP